MQLAEIQEDDSADVAAEKLAAFGLEMMGSIYEATQTLHAEVLSRDKMMRRHAIINRCLIALAFVNSGWALWQAFNNPSALTQALNAFTVAGSLWLLWLCAKAERTFYEHKQTLRKGAELLAKMRNDFAEISKGQQVH